MNKRYILVVVVVSILLGLFYYDRIHVSRLYSPFDRSFGKVYGLANLIPVIPLEDAARFSVLTQPEPIPGKLEEPAPSQSSSSVSITYFPHPPTYGEPPLVLALGLYRTDPSEGSLQPLGVIDWGSEGPIVPREIRNSSAVYLRNEGNAPVGLSLSTSDWVFRDSNGNVLDRDYQQYFSLTWDYDNSEVDVDEVRRVTFVLTVFPEIRDVTAFSFDIVITLTD